LPELDDQTVRTHQGFLSSFKDFEAVCRGEKLVSKAFVLSIKNIQKKFHIQM